VAYISQLEQIINAIGGGLIAGSMVLVSRYTAHGDDGLTCKGWDADAPASPPWHCASLLHPFSVHSSAVGDSEALTTRDCYFQVIMWSSC
jgi:hypothetical protein